MIWTTLGQTLRVSASTDSFIRASGSWTAGTARGTGWAWAGRQAASRINKTRRQRRVGMAAELQLSRRLEATPRLRNYEEFQPGGSSRRLPITARRYLLQGGVTL